MNIVKVRIFSARVITAILFVLYSGYASAGNDSLFKPTVDSKGFIDVWQLRKDVSLVPNRAKISDAEFCGYESDSEDEPISVKEAERRRLQEESCVNDVRQKSIEFERMFAEFNRAWLPVMIEAIRKGDVVAEVIMRQCDTSHAFDRSGIETTCDDQIRKEKAKRRLTEIGFAPALYTCTGNSGSNDSGVATYRYPRTFTFRHGNGVWNTDKFACLSLHRQPETPGYWVWGWGLHYGGGNSEYDGLHYTMPTSEQLASAEAEIERYLKQDPRWAVFLINRVGNHEWIPEGMQSTTHLLDSSWQGEWELVKESYDWRAAMVPGKGRAVISRNGEYTQITIQSEAPKEPLLNVENCTLRYSGGMTYIPTFNQKGQIKPTGTPLGYFYSSGARADDWQSQFSEDGAVDAAVAPLDETKQYKQVLMQCENAESDGTTRIRILLLANDTLVEFGKPRYEYLGGDMIAVRHYRRVK